MEPWMVMLVIVLVGVLALALLTAAAMDDSPGQSDSAHSNRATHTARKPPARE